MVLPMSPFGVGDNKNTVAPQLSDGFLQHREPSGAEGLIEGNLWLDDTGYGAKASTQILLNSRKPSIEMGKSQSLNSCS